jgi:hypothetical protein
LADFWNRAIQELNPAALGAAAAGWLLLGWIVER